MKTTLAFNNDEEERALIAMKSFDLYCDIVLLRDEISVDPEAAPLVDRLTEILTRVNDLGDE